MGKHGVPEAVAALRAGHLPSYAFPEPAAVAMARAAHYGSWLAQPEGALPSFEGVDRARVARVLGAAAEGTERRGRWLRPDEVREVLAAYGIAMPRQGFGASASEAARIASEIGFPVALKLASDTILHKSDVGGVVLGLDSEEAVVAAFASIEDKLSERRSEMRGVLVQQMVKGGIETFVGATWDPQFGHLLGFGIGGVHVELWKDVVFRVAPLRDTEARQMIDQIRARALLEGFRGGPVVDKGAIADVLLRVSCLVHDFPEILEVDVNPLSASAAGVIALDGRIHVRR
jgi:acyl-CoA synthetase (NDP forming)